MWAGGIDDGLDTAAVFLAGGEVFGGPAGRAIQTGYRDARGAIVSDDDIGGPALDCPSRVFGAQFFFGPPVTALSSPPAVHGMRTAQRQPGLPVPAPPVAARKVADVVSDRPPTGFRVDWDLHEQRMILVIAVDPVEFDAAPG